jgi:glutamate-1-semialdehyde 2,1-aminomutase
MEPQSTWKAKCSNGHGPSANLVELRSLLNDAMKNYEKNHPKSLSLHKNALKVLPGGNTRSVLHTDPFPICMDRGEGNRLIDVDGHE